MAKIARAGLALALTGVLLAQTPAPRFPQLKLEETKGDQKALAERMIKETRAGMGGPWNIILRSPGMAEGVVSLYNYYRWKTVLPPAMMEFGVLIVAREWNSPYEWFVHYPLAVTAGMPAGPLADLRANKRPAKMEPVQEAVYDFSIELMRKHVVSNATFDKAKKVLGEQGVVDLTGLVGTYIALAGLLSVSEVGVAKTDGPEYLPVP